MGSIQDLEPIDERPGVLSIQRLLARSMIFLSPDATGSRCLPTHSTIGMNSAHSAAAAECAEFMPIVDWVGRQRESAPSGDDKVVDLASRRWMERTPGLSTIGSRS